MMENNFKWDIQRKSVIVRVPATSANLGPGFDTIGLALDIWNELKVEVSDKQEIIVLGEGESVFPKNDNNLVIVGMKAAFKIGKKISLSPDKSLDSINEACQQFFAQEYNDIVLPSFKYTCNNRIPFARGLGSSSAAVISGLLAGLIILGIELPTTEPEALLNIACAIEGHPDNAAPALYGGLQLGIKYSNDEKEKNSNVSPHWLTSHVAIPNDLQCVLFLPDMITETAQARAILPDLITREDAIFNLSRTALLVNALSTGRLNQLHIAMEDRLHQPYRGKTKAKHLYPMIDAAVKAGAHCACLSGAGSAILALTSGAKGDILTQRQNERMDSSVAAAMLLVAKQINMEGKIFITHPTHKGAHVISTDPPFSEGNVCMFGGSQHL